MEKKLDGQVILVTGAGRGLGASFCHVVAAAGASILALGRDATALNALVDSLPGSGHEMVIADVTDAAAVAAAIGARQARDAAQGGLRGSDHAGGHLLIPSGVHCGQQDDHS